MNSGELLEAGKAAAATVQRIVPEGDRYRWEQQWLRENNRVSGVVHNDEQSFAADASAPTVASPVIAPHAAAPQTMLAAPHLATAQSSDGILAARTPVNAVSRADSTSTPAPIFSSAAAPRDVLYKAATTQPDNNTALLARYKSDPKQFALWRADDEIKISMRLPSSESEHSATLGTLRQWLKDLGLKLTTLIINGNVQWQAKQRTRDDR